MSDDRKLELFEEKLLERVDGYEAIKTVIWNCHRVAEELELDVVGFHIFDHDGVKYLDASFDGDFPENANVISTRICFG